MALTRIDTVRLALTQLGTEESPPYSNRQKYGAWMGFNGVPWCAQFQSWVLAHAGNTSGYRFASTAASVSWARQRGRLVPLDQALPGDVLVKLYSPSIGHTGMATERPANGEAVTVDGNTSDGSDRDGGSVMLRRRALDYWHYCIRLDYPAATQEVPFMFGPFDIRNAVASAKDPVTGGVYLLGSDGAVYAFEGARGVRGVNGQSFFTGRTAATFDRDPAGNAVAPPGKLLTIISTSNERYDLPF